MTTSRQGPPGNRPATRRGGFTLVELMVTMAVAVVLIAIAVPNFRHMNISSRLTSTANELVGALNVARIEAIKRNAPAQFCSNASTANGSDTLGTRCAGDAGAVYLMASGSPVLIRAPSDGLFDTIRLKGDIQAVRYGGDGFGHAPAASAPLTATVATICTTGFSTGNMREIKIASGSVITVTTTTGTCS